jgi:hypothetical protein
VERARVTYQHRLSARGEPLNYVAIVAQKTGMKGTLIVG